jgi:hypothetical protein
VRLLDLWKRAATGVDNTGTVGGGVGDGGEKEKPPVGGFSGVDPAGLEPAAFGVPRRRSPN